MPTTNNSRSGSSQSSHSRSEAGHPKNVASLNVLYNTCLGFGSSYNPSNAAITTTAMQALYTAADNAVTNADYLKNTLEQAINARANAFEDVKKKATRILAALVASGADAETLKNARAIDRKIQGKRAKAVEGTANNNGSSNPITPPDNTVGDPVTGRPSAPVPAPQPGTISVLQQSYDRLVSNLKILINYASQVSTYNPNETDLQMAALNAYWATLQNANNGVITARVSFNNALTTRTKILYDAVTGLVHVGLVAKQYVVSVYGANSLQAKQVKRIHFKTIKR